MKLSVCMASYNGSRYIKEQISSILLQLSAHDELIISDDNSSDDTVKIASSFNDLRIRIYESNINIGCVKNFERSISFARGDIIFLSDQDDVWEKNKVSEIKAVFLRHPDVSIIHHARSLMDADGKVYDKHCKNLKDGPFNNAYFLIRQLLKGQMYGCAIAFRTTMKQYILPIPKSAYAHDDWIALVSGVMGKVYSLNKALIRYRWHSNNFTVKNPLSYIDKARIRIIQLALVLQIFQRVLVNKYLKPAGD